MMDKYVTGMAWCIPERRGAFYYMCKATTKNTLPIYQSCVIKGKCCMNKVMDKDA
jgi:hypothetical protein